MTIATSTRRLIAVLFVAGMILNSSSRADALYMEGKSIERPIDWTLKVGNREFGIAEEVHVRVWFFNEHDGREVLSVGTAICFGVGAVTVPSRFRVG